MHYGLVAPELHGHLNPITTLGAELARRGHQVTVLGSQRGRPFAERAGLGWAAMNDNDQISKGWDRLGELSGLAAMRFTGQLLTRTMQSTLEQAPGVIAEQRIDALVVDQLSPAAAVVAERLDLPYAVACNAIAIHVTPEVPPPPLAWSYRSDFWGRLRNRVGNRLCLTLFTKLSGAKNVDGVTPTMLARLDEPRGAAMVSQQPACFDFPNHPRPAYFHYTAPWHAAGRDRDVPFPWERLDERRPLVYASLGTLQNKLKHVYAAIAQAARGLDAQVVLSLGSDTASLDLDPPDNVIIAPFAPQLRLLERATAVITHAGLNTTLETLARGLPMLCLPITNDQPGIASRVKHLGAGETLSVSTATAQRIRERLDRVLASGSYRAAAQRLQAQFTGINGPAVAADIIERAVG
ncbi:MAG: glycosyltransferase family 1 protein [Planctomycetales bacterium]|nr:glycosyltransferase family 1 protein [Planctomycetales bacterium]